MSFIFWGSSKIPEYQVILFQAHQCCPTISIGETSNDSILIRVQPLARFCSQPKSFTLNFILLNFSGWPPNPQRILLKEICSKNDAPFLCSVTGIRAIQKWSSNSSGSLWIPPFILFHSISYLFLNNQNWSENQFLIDIHERNLNHVSFL